MKYLAWFAGAFAVLAIMAIVLGFIAWVMIQAATQPELRWMLAIVGVIFFLAVIVTVVEYLTDQRKEPPDAA
jgi:phosphotransferase system  glucose/maltose/N-acetylglucosamine-specific IIC component